LSVFKAARLAKKSELLPCPDSHAKREEVKQCQGSVVAKLCGQAASLKRTSFISKFAEHESNELGQKMKSQPLKAAKPHYFNL